VAVNLHKKGSDAMNSIAVRFVDLAIRCQPWDKVTELFPGEARILFDLVSAAGFEPKEVALGELRGDHHDQDGPTGKTYPINELCPFKVISEKGEDHYPATRWLDKALSHVVSGASQKDKTRDQLIEEILLGIERSVPLEPIQLTSEGDLLMEYPRDSNGFGREDSHVRDSHQLNSTVGLHKYCLGWVDRKRATKTHDALVCRTCYMRILFPIEVKTYGELRQALAQRVSG